MKYSPEHLSSLASLKITPSPSPFQSVFFLITQCEKATSDPTQPVGPVGTWARTWSISPAQLVTGLNSVMSKSMELQLYSVCNNHEFLQTLHRNQSQDPNSSNILAKTASLKRRNQNPTAQSSALLQLQSFFLNIQSCC